MSIESLVQVILSELKKEYTNESDTLNALRYNIEPYIYNYLSIHYYSKLKEHWLTYKPPKESKHVFAIIERRCHPNFDFVLKNIAWANPNMAVYIFCSDENESYIHSLLEDKISHFNIIKVFSGNVSKEEGKRGYNNLLTSTDFYKSFGIAEYLLTIQMDVFIRREITDELFVGDYWGNPWAWQSNTPGGGGATIRKISTMIDICSKESLIQDNPNAAEDAWIAKQIQDKNYT